MLAGTSIAVLTYIGFDGISTLSEEAENPRRNILLATVLTCLVIGILSAVEVYAAQLIWPAIAAFPDVDTAFVHVAGRAWVPLFAIIGFTLLVANFGSGMGAQLGAARLLYGMGRSNALPKSFFGVVDPKHAVPRNNVLFVGAIALLGAFVMSYDLGAEMLNFGALIAFMGVNAAASCAISCANRREAVVYRATGPRIRDLPVALAEPQHAGQDRRHHLDGGWNRFRRLEDPRLPRRPGELRSARGRIKRFCHPERSEGPAVLCTDKKPDPSLRSG